ncbi:hypothetical protein R5R35_003754 [Gryllus longicercus]|uniref:Uncharacterized protein n=1 Tax=Gryllus longicercus TaxID=2509291 RepID=A0AAN9W1G5_9ORTH
MSQEDEVIDLEIYRDTFSVECDGVSEVCICDWAIPNNSLLDDVLEILLMVTYFLIVTVVIHQVFYDHVFV